MPRAVHQLSCDDYCEELLKMSFNTITSYVCLNHRHGLWRTIVTFVIKTCFKTCLPGVNYNILPKCFEQYIPNNKLATNTRITRQHNLLRAEKPRTHFSSKLPRHHFIELWKNLNYNIQNVKPRHKFKSLLSKQYLSNYLNQVHCLNPRCVECN